MQRQDISEGITECALLVCLTFLLGLVVGAAFRISSRQSLFRTAALIHDWRLKPIGIP